MLKSIPNFATRTGNAIIPAYTQVSIAQEGADTLAAKLDIGDWIYMALDDGIAYEVVRVTAINGIVVLMDRNADGSGAYEFMSDARMSYILPQPAVADIVNQILSENLNVTGTGAATVTQTGPFGWNIDVKRIVIVSDDPDIEVVDTYPTFFIIKK